MTENIKVKMDFSQNIELPILPEDLLSENDMVSYNKTGHFGFHHIPTSQPPQDYRSSKLNQWTQQQNAEVQESTPDQQQNEYQHQYQNYLTAATFNKDYQTRSKDYQSQPHAKFNSFNEMIGKAILNHDLKGQTYFNQVRKQSVRNRQIQRNQIQNGSFGNNIQIMKLQKGVQKRKLNKAKKSLQNQPFRNDDLYTHSHRKIVKFDTNQNLFQRVINAEIGNVSPEPEIKQALVKQVKKDQNPSNNNLNKISDIEKQRLEEIISRGPPLSSESQGAFNLTFHSNANNNLLTNKIVQTQLNMQPAKNQISDNQKNEKNDDQQLPKIFTNSQLLSPIQKNIMKSFQSQNKIKIDNLNSPMPIKQKINNFSQMRLVPMSVLSSKKSRIQNTMGISPLHGAKTSNGRQEKKLISNQILNQRQFIPSRNQLNKSQVLQSQPKPDLRVGGKLNLLLENHRFSHQFQIEDEFKIDKTENSVPEIKPIKYRLFSEEQGRYSKQSQNDLYNLKKIHLRDEQPKITSSTKLPAAFRIQNHNIKRRQRNMNLIHQQLSQMTHHVLQNY